jgi:hypothetical protein
LTAPSPLQPLLHDFADIVGRYSKNGGMIMDGRWFERLTFPGVIVLGAALGGLMAFAMSLLHATSSAASG